MKLRRLGITQKKDTTTIYLLIQPVKFYILEETITELLLLLLLAMNSFFIKNKPLCDTIHFVLAANHSGVSNAKLLLTLKSSPYNRPRRPRGGVEV
jgi:hypothetical protein